MLHRRAALSLASGAFAAAGLNAGTARRAAAASPPVPRAGHPEEIGFSAERLGRITAWLSGEVERGTIPGATVAVGRRGKLGYFEAIGLRDREANAPMRPDTVFRIYSMTKPIVSLALMMLAEEGKVQLVHPVSRYLPEFRDQKVGVPRTIEGRTELALVPADRPATVQDLLRHTSGLSYGNGEDPVSLAYKAAKLNEKGIGPDEFIRRLAALPLMYQPGTTWEYSHSTDVVGRIVEVVSGEDLNTFVTRRITGPLGMADTAFFHNEALRDRLAQPQNDPATGRRPELVNPLERPSWFSGGGGMSGTTMDYARFCQMLLDKGQAPDGPRLVARKTIDLMTANHLTPSMRSGASTPAFLALAPTPEMGQGFGLGFAVRTDEGRNPLPGSIGDYFWGGAQGTYFWIDPREEMYAILMMQSSSYRLQARWMMRQLTYQALI